jgi:hypothetical protein
VSRADFTTSALLCYYSQWVNNLLGVEVHGRGLEPYHLFYLHLNSFNPLLGNLHTTPCSSRCSSCRIRCWCKCLWSCLRISSSSCRCWVNILCYWICSFYIIYRIRWYRIGGANVTEVISYSLFPEARNFLTNCNSSGTLYLIIRERKATHE